MFLSIEDRAGGIADSAEKLRYLRRSHEARRRGWKSARTLGGIAVAVVFCGFLLHVPAKHSAAAVVARTTGGTTPITAHVTAHISPSKVWLVETHESSATYSNGLQIRTDYLTHSEPRSYSVYARETLIPSAPRSVPAGIVFHTTESLLVPLAAEHAGRLLRAREGALSHIRRDGLYNFVVDRFGQVFRVVPEDEVAHHAGHSVWADSTGIYEGLNDSFIGVAFEARTEESGRPSEAQLRSGRLLTEFLRGRYGIPESNCVTHAQVSVNPENMRIGYHTDWATNFPFSAMDLAPGYALPVAAVEFFGFEYDQQFVDSIGGRPWDGLIAADQAVVRRAQSRGMPPRTYQTYLQRQYRQLRSHVHERKTATPRT
jgi:hypothetical protein